MIHDGGQGSVWWGYETGIASGLVGRPDDTSCFLRGVSDERVIWRAAPLLPFTARPDAYRREVGEAVAQERARLNLAPLDGPAF